MKLVSTDRAAQIMELRMLGWRMERHTVFSNADMVRVVQVAWHAVNGPRQVSFVCTLESDAWASLIFYLNHQKDYDLC